MQPPQQHSWINLAELKAQLIKKLGPERSKQYFDYLTRLLSSKVSKVEFDKLCLRVVGRENIPLHNQFIRSILKNACTGKVPPQLRDVEALNSTKAVGNKKHTEGILHQNGALPTANQASSPLSFPNGDVLPQSPRKARTVTRDRRVGDRRSALGPNGKTNLACQPPSITQSGDFNALENGTSPSPDTRRLVQHHQGPAEQAENGDEILVEHHATFSVTDRSPDGLVSVHSKGRNESVGREGGKEVSGRDSVRAPLGVPYCPVSIGGARRALPLASSSKYGSMFNTDGLLDTIALRDRMDQVAATQGLQGVSMESANIMNHGLDAYLKGLIRSCAELNGARSGHEPMMNASSKHQAHLRPLNGVRPGHYYQIQGNGWPLDSMQEHEAKHPISLLDFRVAMELNPQQLGEDWPLLLEKICTHAFDE